MYRLYTHNDLDGVGCGIVAKLAFNGNVEIRYNSVMGLDFQIARFLEKPKKDDYIFITDLSVNEKNEKGLDEFVKNGGKVQLLDHHKTALHFNEYSWGKVKVHYDDGRLVAATSLFYEYLKEEGIIKPTHALEQFVELVRQYDTWEWDQNNNLEAKQLNDLFFMLSIDEFEERMVERLKTSQTFSFNEFEEKMLELESEKIQRYVRKKKRELVQTFICGFCTGVVHAESYHSELGNELGKENPHLDYIAIVSVGGKRMSLRTIHDHIDVSEIAGIYGGGGHAKAAGCSLTAEAYEFYVAEPFKIDPLRADAFRNIYNVKESVHGSLYGNKDEDLFFVFASDDIWHVEWNGSLIDEAFETFQAAENYLKRNHAVWLVRDEVFVQYLIENNMAKYQADINNYHSTPQKGDQELYTH
jgi:uncharacterized protein